MERYALEYEYAPRPNRGKLSAVMISLLLLSASVLSVALSGNALAKYFISIATIPFFAAMLVARRFITAEYTYSVMRNVDSGERCLVINERHAGKTATVCFVSLFDIEEVRAFASTPKKKGIKKPKPPRPDRKDYKHLPVYNYCAHITPAGYCLIRLGGSDPAYVKFTPDDRLASMLK